MPSERLLSSLKEDHKYMIKLLHLLEQEIKTLDAAQVVRVNLDRLLEMTDYLNQYPEICHHPIEERMFGMLASKSLPEHEQALIDKVIDEHGMLDALAELLEVKIARYLAANCSKASLLRTADMFLRQQIKHIECEQNHVFTLCCNYLQNGEWQELQALEEEIRQADDELCSYELLRQKIAGISSAALRGR